MNITYLISIVLAFAFMLFGIIFDGMKPNFGNLPGFFDPASILIVVGCTLAVVLASFPASMTKSMGKHFKIILNNKQFDPMYYIDQLTELAQIARKNGLLALEEKANEQTDPFFKQAIMLIVDANDPDRVRSILQNNIDCMSNRHEDVAAMYDRASSVAPAFGMVGTLVGLIKMLLNLKDSDMGSLGPSMGTALITTLYGCILAHIIFGPIASNLRGRDEEEVLCKEIVLEGVMSIQSGENPKFLRERLLTFMNQKLQEDGEGAGGTEKSGKKGRGKKKKGE